MTSKMKKFAGGALAALMLGVALTATATPSEAQGYGYHRGGYGRGWHGGYRGGYWRGGRGNNWGAPVAAGVIGGLALGALAAGAAGAYGNGYGYAPSYGYAPAYGGCYLQNRPAYDGWGNIIGYQPVQVCY